MLTVDPDRNAFILPIINHPIAWYGILFALGFFFSYLIVRACLTDRLKSKEDATLLTDKLTLYTVIGAIVGARLFEVFFYAWPYYQEHPIDILKVWEGGLASHGGAIGVVVAIVYFYYSNRKRYPRVTFLSTLDYACIGGAITGCLIRIGNFINQEILGTVTTVPWAVVFLHPVDDLPVAPRHPVQLYESLFYFIVFISLFVTWKKMKGKMQDGRIAGLFFTLLFGFRFFIEWVKESQGLQDTLFLSMGQILSVPLTLFGLYLCFRRVHETK